MGHGFRVVNIQHSGDYNLTAFCDLYSWYAEIRLPHQYAPFPEYRLTGQSAISYRNIEIGFDEYGDQGMVVPILYYWHSWVSRTGQQRTEKVLWALDGESTREVAEAAAKVAWDRHVMPYPAYLRTPWWSWMREDANADGRCRLCGSRKQIDVHHNTYARRGFEDVFDLIPLCRLCHSEFHAHNRP
jgi:hypothetical protein